VSRVTSPQIPPGQPTLRDGDISLVPLGGSRAVMSFAVERAERVAGSVDISRDDDGNGLLSWDVHADHRGRGTGLRAVRLLIDYVFAELGVWRVEAYVDPRDVASLRLAGRAGLRREGLVRGHNAGNGNRIDRVLLARLAEDPEPTTPEGFRSVLNAALPTKRVIAQGLLRDGDDRVLLCELTYKPDWDLPGGVVEPDESPHDCVQREVAEELGITVTAGDLLTVDWLPPWAGWDDACLLTFDLGRADSDLVDAMRLEPREIAAVHWADPATVQRRCRPQVAERLVLLGGRGPVPSFLHSGRPPT